MKILAIESSGLVASAAMASDDRIIGEYTANTDLTHSKTLLPMIDELAHLTGEDLSTVDYIAVSSGPGSFTGLRIGSATAKGLAFAWDKMIVPVPTVDSIAWNMAGAEGYVCPVLDARRGQTYTGIYSFHSEDGIIVMDTVRPQCAVTIDEIIDDLNERGENVTFLGDGVPVFSGYIKEHLKVPFAFAPIHERLQRAGTLASLGLVLAKEGKALGGDEFRPEYLRETQAERERKKKNGGA